MDITKQAKQTIIFSDDLQIGVGFICNGITRTVNNITKKGYRVSGEIKHKGLICIVNKKSDYWQVVSIKK